MPRKQPDANAGRRAERQTTAPLPHLGTFAKAAELSSFTAAGRELGLTQAAVSQRIHALERVLGVALFCREGGRVLLSEAGRCLYGYAQRILALDHEARERVTGQTAAVSGELVVAASSVPGDFLLPGLLSVFQTQYPAIRVRATVLDSLEVLRQVEQGKAHVGLVGRKKESKHLEFRAFAADEMVLVVPRGHRWARTRRVSLNQLAQEPFIVREAASGSRWCLEQALARARASLDELRVALEMGSNEAIKEAVMQGMGVAVRRELEAGDLVAVKVARLDLKRPLLAVWDARRVLPAPARVFLHFLEPCPGGK